MSLKFQAFNLRKFIRLIVSCAIPLLVGILAQLISGGTELYETVAKPPLSPPSIVFPIVWTILFILMGINEYGANVSTWKEQYRKIIQGVRDRAPGAEIYVHAILPVNDGRARANGYYVTNAIIAPMNNALKALAQEENCFFIDAREAIALSDGTLPYEAASDGIHPTYKYCDIWGDWLIEQICK